MRKLIGYVFILVLIFLGVTFALLNATPVSFNYYLGVRTLPLSLLLVFSFSCGGLVGIAIGLFMMTKVMIANRRLQKRIILIEKEVENLRAIPLRDHS